MAHPLPTALLARDNFPWGDLHKGLFKFAETVNCLLLDVTGPDSGDSGHQFRVEITEVVLTRVGEPPDHLVIESWHPDRGLARREAR